MRDNHMSWAVCQWNHECEFTFGFVLKEIIEAFVLGHLMLWEALGGGNLLNE